MGILILLGIAVVAIFACYWMTVGAFRLLIRLLGLPKYQDVVVPSKYSLFQYEMSLKGLRISNMK
ncbi:MAG: hypothetical protein WAT12_05035 [Candidatus Nitrotoga sp.]